MLVFFSFRVGWRKDWTGLNWTQKTFEKRQYISLEGHIFLLHFFSSKFFFFPLPSQEIRRPLDGDHGSSLVLPMLKVRIVSTELQLTHSSPSLHSASAIAVVLHPHAFSYTSSFVKLAQFLYSKVRGRSETPTRYVCHRVIGCKY